MFIDVLNKKEADVTPFISFGTAITIYGIASYYQLPLALLSMNLGLLSKIMIFILMGLLFALTLLAFNYQGMFEKVCTKVFLFFEHRSTQAMVIKNLASHRKRN